MGERGRRRKGREGRWLTKANRWWKWLWGSTRRTWEGGLDGLGLVLRGRRSEAYTVCGGEEVGEFPGCALQCNMSVIYLPRDPVDSASTGRHGNAPVRHMSHRPPQHFEARRPWWEKYLWSDQGGWSVS